jgi:hypothetical protein
VDQVRAEDEEYKADADQEGKEADPLPEEGQDGGQNPDEGEATEVEADKGADGREGRDQGPALLADDQHKEGGNEYQRE